jgi:toxin ParE1/3/4
VNVSLASEAEHELVAAAKYYTAQANLELGEAFLSEFERSALLLAEYPSIGTRWRGTTRRLPLRRFPYTVVYVVRNAEIRIIAVAHQSRRPGYWRGRV